MPRSLVQVYLHFVWATQRRQPFVTPELEPQVHECVRYEAQKLGCTVLAVGGMPDHVHLLARMPATPSPGQMMKQVEGTAARFINEISALSEALYWQEGYGVFSVSPAHRTLITDYVNGQKRHHAEGTLLANAERAGDE